MTPCPPLSRAFELTKLCLSHPISFALVHHGTAGLSWIGHVEQEDPAAVIYDVNLAEQTDDVKAGLLDNDFAARFLGEPTQRRIPYLRSFVQGMGPIDTIYNPKDIPKMIQRARNEREQIDRIWRQQP